MTEALSATTDKCYEHYMALNKQSGEVLKLSFEKDALKLQAKAHAIIADFDILITLLDNRYEKKLYQHALREYQFALFSVIHGLYRQAFMSLRFFMEQAIAAMHFSTNEFDYRLWSSGQKDISWQQLLDDENGILSRKFSNAFYGMSHDDFAIYKTLARQVYRECSEYVHGNPSSHESLPGRAEYSQQLFTEWHEKATSVKMVLIVAFCIRYVKTFDADKLRKIEPVVLDHISHVKPITEFVVGGTSG